MKIVSGGQTGVDRGALDAALDCGVEIGGWCPRGRRAEDGVIPARYALVETPQPAYLQRTRWNVRDSDVTLLLHAGEMGAGSRATISFCRELKKPNIIIDMRNREAKDNVIAFLREYSAVTVNVAGPRESGNQGIQERTRHFMSAVIKEFA